MTTNFWTHQSSLSKESSPEGKSSVYLRQYSTMKLIRLSLWMFSCHCIQFSAVLAAATSTILMGQSLTSPDTLVSPSGIFELGFFSPGNSSYAYLGIWYKKIEERTVVWVGNPDLPLTASSPSLAIDRANLVILDGRITYQVSDNSVSGSVSATLLDSGNLVLREESSEAFLWQSFDYPSHTYLPGMKLGYSRTAGKVWALRSWKNATDPRPGDFSLKIEPESPEEFVILKGSEKYWTTGLWDRDKHMFFLLPEMRLNSIFNFSFISNRNESYLTYSLVSSFGNTSRRFVMDLSGQIKQFSWLGTLEGWGGFWTQPQDQCDVYKFCGSFSRCKNSTFSASCDCLDGFRPSDQEKWQKYDRSAGCVRKIPLQCEGYKNGDKDGFLKMDRVSFPLYYKTLERISTEACESACSGDCSCTAYAYNGSGTGWCLLWHGDLLNLRQFSEDNPKTIHIKLAAYEFQNRKLQKSQGIGKTLKIAPASVIPLVAIFLITYIICPWKKKQKGKMGPTQDILLFDVDMSIAASTDETSLEGIGNERNTKGAWLPLFSFSSVTSATENFSLRRMHYDLI
ncbi:hypothetical protein BT93_F2866 [Corymbia citriodora subsp. variegata]|nr:hypothetical protein BT93_F2866 [Corymbia citriodora subsp. variegata]